MMRMIEVVPHDPSWVLTFRDAAGQITEVVGLNLLAVHHIGSTAVPCLAAKPTIDILLVVQNLEELEVVDAALADLGYQAKGENGIPGRRYYQKLDGERHLVHIHAFKAGNSEITRHLNFRDYLIAHPQAAHAYQVLKQRLAVRFRETPKDYTAGKESFIRDIDARAAAWRAGLHQGKEDDACTPN